MRRAGNLFEEIVDRENLRLAFVKTVRGKRDRVVTRRFAAGLENELGNMVAALHSGTFPLGQYRQFVIHDPKRRIITAPCFAERVLHHAVMNICEPKFENWLINDTFACRPDRGRAAALTRSKLFARRFAYFIKLDIRRYFDSIPHTILLSRLEKLYKDHRLLGLFRDIVGSFRGHIGIGLPIGSLTSQHLANFYLGWFDRYVKEILRVKGYVRYMDDMALWADSPADLKAALAAGRTYLRDQLELEIKGEPSPNRTLQGMSFLGCRVFQNRITLNRRSRLRFRRKLGHIERKFLRGEIDELELQQRSTSLLAFTRSGGVWSWQFRRSVVKELEVSGQLPRTGLSGVAAGTMTPGTAVRRTATGTSRGTGTTTWAFAWPSSVCRIDA